MTYIFDLIIYIIIVMSSVFHEYMHGWMANHLGDPTAKLEGRLTLNPLKHIDMWGTVIVPIASLLLANIFIGWAKPVPYNPYNLRDQKNGPMKVGLAGPAANFAIAIFFGLLVRFMPDSNATLVFLLELIVYINIFLGLFNLIPVPPLDGSKIFGELSLTRNSARFPQESMIGIIIALIIAFYLLPYVANFFFQLFTGVSFNL